LTARNETARNLSVAGFIFVRDGRRILSLILALVAGIQPTQVLGLKRVYRVADATLLDPGTRPG
jgi:hypothetical protein